MATAEHEVQCRLCDARFGTQAELANHEQAEHRSKIEEERSRVDEDLDEQLRESFPASDAPSTSTVTGIGAPDGGSAEPRSNAPQTDAANEIRETRAGGTP